jgi:hypothetical protein
MADRAFAALVRKLHAAELQHLRQLVAEQQAQIDELAAQVHRLEGEVIDADRRGDMYLDLANELRDLQPGAQFGITQDGRMGVLQ